jgi:hypothetical protein
MEAQDQNDQSQEQGTDVTLTPDIDYGPIVSAYDAQLDGMEAALETAVDNVNAAESMRAEAQEVLDSLRPKYDALMAQREAVVRILNGEVAPAVPAATKRGRPAKAETAEGGEKKASGRGGARPGAGRKPAAAKQEAEVATPAPRTPISRPSGLVPILPAGSQIDSNRRTTAQPTAQPASAAPQRASTVPTRRSSRDD